MDFCKVCDYKLYAEERRLEGGEYVLERKCKNCGFTSQENQGPIKVSETYYSYDELIVQQFTKNKYLSFDPSLPRITDPDIINCPNKECPGVDGKQSIIYIKFNHIDMKYLFKCEHCNTTILKN